MSIISNEQYSLYIDQFDALSERVKSINVVVDAILVVEVYAIAFTEVGTSSDFYIAAENRYEIDDFMDFETSTVPRAKPLSTKHYRLNDESEVRTYLRSVADQVVFSEA